MEPYLAEGHWDLRRPIVLKWSLHRKMDDGRDGTTPRDDSQMVGWRVSVSGQRKQK